MSDKVNRHEKQSPNCLQMQHDSPKVKDKKEHSLGDISKQYQTSSKKMSKKRISLEAGEDNEMGK